jgi:phenylacetic acid degradation protein
MPCYEFEGVRPIVDPSAYVHPTATLIGDVMVGPGCLVGPGASLRGDIGRLVMEAGSNVQDNCVVHCFPGKDVVIERDGHVGHGAVLHGCRIGRNALVGMNAVIMDGAMIGEESFVAAMAFVRAGTEVPARGWKSDGTAVYQHLARRYLATAKEVEPLPAPERDRPTLPELGYEPKREQT